VSGATPTGVTAVSGPDAAVREAHVAVARTARYYVVGDPATARVAWVALHGYGQLGAYFARHFAAHAGEGSGRVVVVPEALSRFYLGSGEGGGAHARVGATWMTREDRLVEIADYVAYLDRVLDAALPADRPALPLGVLGFSQGAVTACRWLHHRHRAARPPAARLVLWGGAVPHDLDLARDGDALRATPPLVVVGDEDPFVTAQHVADQEARLAAAGLPYRVRRYAGGHRLDAAVLGEVLGELGPA
jgi:predicted esterase